MKSGLNLICVLIIMVLGFSVGQITAEGSTDFNDGVDAGYNMGTKHETQPQNIFMDREKLQTFSLIPDTYTAASDSVYNAKTGSFVPAHIRRVSVVLDSPMSTLFQFLVSVAK